VGQLGKVLIGHTLLLGVNSAMVSLNHIIMKSVFDMRAVVLNTV